MNSHLNALHIRFLPEQEQELNISSRQFLKKADFINVDNLLKKEEEAESEGNSTGGNEGGGGESNGGGFESGGD